MEVWGYCVIWSVYGKTMNGRWIGKQRESAGQKGSNILRPCPLSITRVLAAGLVPAARKKARPDLARVLADPEYRNKLYKQSQQPRSKLTGHQTCNAAELRGIDPCGSRQMCMQACPLGSLPAGINYSIRSICTFRSAFCKYAPPSNVPRMP